MPRRSHRRTEERSLSFLVVHGVFPMTDAQAFSTMFGLELEMRELTLEHVAAERGKLLDELAAAEAAYRKAYELKGASKIETGRAWDRMRKAGDRARRSL